MNPHHDIMDDIALLALGVLPENEASTIAAHLEDCETCRQAYTEFRTSANLIGYAGEPVSATLDEVAAARLKARVMNAVRPSSHSNGEAVVSPAQALARPRSAWFPYAVAAAALVFATVVASDDAGLRKRAASENEQIDALQAHAAVQDEVLAHSDTRTRDIDARVAELLAPGQKHFAIPGGEVVSGGGHILIAVRGLPQPPPGKVYQAWTLSRGAKKMTPSITFLPDSTGVAMIELPGRATNLAAVAVSVEPAGGSTAPSSTPTFVRPLS